MDKHEQDIKQIKPDITGNYKNKCPLCIDTIKNFQLFTREIYYIIFTINI